MSAITTLAFALLLTQTSSDKSERARHPLAPSLPILTDAEIARYEAVVERFIQYDIGKLPKAQGEKAKEEFLRLGPDAIFVLIEGFNRAAEMEHSCPAVIIGKKITSLLRATDDLVLLGFAKDTIGAGVKARRHLGVVKDLQVTCILRKGFLQSQNLAAKNSPRPAPITAPPSSMAKFTQGDFVTAVKSEQGPKLKALLAEADKRNLFEVLVIAAARPETEAKEIGQSFLDKNLTQKSSAQLKDLLKHTKREARAAAAKAIGQRGLHLERELIDTLSDESVDVQQSARQALVQLAKGQDFGPDADASTIERTSAIQRWRVWLEKSKS